MEGSAWRLLLKNRTMASIWLAGLVSVAGDWLMMVMLPFSLWGFTHSVKATGLLVIVQSVSRLAFGSIAGVFVDRWNRRKVMLICDFLRVPLLLLLLLVHSLGTVWLIYVVSFLEVMCAQFYVPAESALLPSLVEQGQLVSVNAMFQSRNSAISIFGPLIGGILYGLMSLGGASIFDSATFLVSGLLIVSLKLMSRRENHEGETLERSSFWQDWIAGLKIVGQVPTVKAIFLVMGLAMFAQGTISVTMVPFMEQMQGAVKGAHAYSYVASSQGLGMLLGGLLMDRLNKIFKTEQIVVIGGLLTGVIFFVQSNLPFIQAQVICSTLTGFPVIWFFIAAPSILQRDVPDEYLGRVFGSYNTTNSILTLASMGMSTLMLNSFGPVVMRDIGSIMYMLAGVAALFALPYPLFEKIIKAGLRRSELLVRNAIELVLQMRIPK